MRPTLSLVLQRIWNRSEPSLKRLVQLLPKPLKLVFFRALAAELRICAVTVEGDSGAFQGDPCDLAVITEYMLKGTYSPELVRLLTSRLAENGTGSFLDIGANIGLTTVPMARAGADCFAFEPDVRNFERLRLNTQSVVERVKLFNVALFDANTEVDFEISEWNHGDHRVRVGAGSGAFGEQNRRVVKITAERLDDVLDVGTLRRPLIVKIDTQGAEAKIIRGGVKTLAEADLLSIEFCPYLIRRMGEREDSIIDFIAANFAYGVVANWHGDVESLEWLPIAKLVSDLRAFSAVEKTTRHLDLLLTRLNFDPVRRAAQ